jgi:hypothetical protein
VELVYPDQENGLLIAILPAYNPAEPDNPTGWIPAVGEGTQEESEFYTMVRAAKFVGHGNRRAKAQIVSPVTFDGNAPDPYAALYEYCSGSDYWSYLTKDSRGRNITGEVEGAILPRLRDFFVANVIDLTLGERGGVFITELSEAVARRILYAKKKSGVTWGLAFDKRVGDITCPDGALGIEVKWGGRGYSADPFLDESGAAVRVKIPDALLPHRRHMENPATFINKPGDPQEIVDQLATLLRGYHDNPKGIDETAALKEAMDEAFGENTFKVDVPASASIVSMGGARSLAGDMIRQLDKQGIPAPEPKRTFIPNRDDCDEREEDEEKREPEATWEKEPEKPREEPGVAPRPTVPGESIDPLDIAKMREALMGGKP